ncbi:Uroporphyrinogen-III synthase [hydrothermal vent metagenome]|uniref:uroporphyrinogen-III synthase n=1 Tax=hydrothermal vent metagenome TaxID=652676 RepID=A0A3B0XKJ2_9ZZZZ
MNVENPIVLVTRPVEQGLAFIKRIKEKGINAKAFPCIEIQAVDLNESLTGVLNSLREYDLIIFISANAVQHGARVLAQYDLKPASITTKIATIGKATLDAAVQIGFDVTISPDNGFNSEALLALGICQQKHIKDKRCLIFRGVGGLETLATELKKRGAQVDYAEVYQRSKPEHDLYLSRFELSRDWLQFNISVITATSNESIQNLYDMIVAPGKKDMLETKLVVASRRGVELAQSLGFISIQCAQSAMNQHMLQALEIELN